MLSEKEEKIKEKLLKEFFVELLDSWGSDLEIVNIARVSFGKRATFFGEREKKLLHFLWKNKHTSPFRHCFLKYNIKCPIFVERQLFKHQVGLTANSISGRYVDFSDSYWFPINFRKQSKEKKQGSEPYYFKNKQKVEELLNLYKEHIENSKKLYEIFLENEVAKEIARTILPLSLNTEFIWTGSLQAFLHLFELRLAPDAQEETRKVVYLMYLKLKEIQKFSETLKVWKETLKFNTVLIEEEEYEI